MEEISCIDNSFKNLDNIKKRKITFEPIIHNKKRKINNDINTLTYNLNKLRLKRKSEDEQNISNKKIKILNNNIINYDNLFIPIENNLKRKNDISNELDKLDGIHKLTKKNKLMEEKNQTQDINILNCNCIHICRCDYDYEYFKENNKKLPPDDLIYRYIN